MKKTLIMCCVLLASISVLGQKKSKTDNIADMVSSKTDTLSYSVGKRFSLELQAFLAHTDLLGEEGTKAKEENMKSFNQGLESAINETDTKKIAQNLGVMIGSSLLIGVEDFSKTLLSDTESLDKNIILAAIKESLSGAEPFFENTGKYLEDAGNEKRRLENEKADLERAEKNKEVIAEGKKFLDDNKNKVGIISLPSGLQYKVIEQGAGSKPTTADRVKVNYEGRLIDGTVFDSSYERGEPITFAVTQVIKGWTEILQLMPAGSKWEVFIPQDLAYGSRDMGDIPPFSTLVFTIELIEIAK